MNLLLPMLAPHESVDLDLFTDYPVYVSPKYDGIRCLIDESGTPVSRTLKPIQNRYITAELQKLKLPTGMDGELVTLTDSKVDPYNTVQSNIMTRYARPEQWKYVVFDLQSPKDFYHRHHELLSWWSNLTSQSPHLEIVPQILCDTRLFLESLEVEFLSRGFEGLMLKTPHGRYKGGRTTLTESISFKLKRFEDSEALVMGMTQALENTNPQQEDHAGNAKRSKHQEGMVPKEEMGNLVVKDIHHPEYEQFEIGTGFTHENRVWWWKRCWDSDEPLTNIIVKYKFQKHGTDKRPRCPVYLGIRNPQDL